MTTVGGVGGFSPEIYNNTVGRASGLLDDGSQSPSYGLFDGGGAKAKKSKPPSFKPLDRYSGPVLDNKTLAFQVSVHRNINEIGTSDVFRLNIGGGEHINIVDSELDQSRLVRDTRDLLALSGSRI